MLYHSHQYASEGDMVFIITDLRTLDQNHLHPLMILYQGVECFFFRKFPWSGR